MKYIRIIFIILSIIWMIAVFVFSNQPADESSKTSSFVTEKIVRVVYGDNLNEEELNIKMELMHPVIRKLAHYTLYLTGGIIIGTAVFTYSIDTKKKIAITQSIGSIYSITDEIHQNFISGRSMQITDVLIDSFGVLSGIILVLILIKIYCIMRKTKKGVNTL